MTSYNRRMRTDQVADGDDGSERSAEEILAEYMAALDHGEEFDIEALCVRHPEHTDELRERYEDGREMLGEFAEGRWPPVTVEDDSALASDADTSGTIRRLQERDKAWP